MNPNLNTVETHELTVKRGVFGSKELLGRDNEIATDIAEKIWMKHHGGMNRSGVEQGSSRDSLKQFIREAINRSREA